MLQVHVESGRHPAALRRWFPALEPDPFFEGDILCALYGDGWTSIVIEEDGHALRHAFSASAIGTTGLLDIEPLLGYAGPLSTPDAPADFLIAALERYGALCRDNGIIAELVRFNPLLENHRALDGLSADLVLPASKPVVYLSVHDDEAALMSRYPATTRNMVRAGYRSSTISTLDKTAETWTELRQFYERTLQETAAEPRWWLSPDLWERLRQHPRFLFFGAVQHEQPVSGAIALVHGSTWYYFLAAGARDPHARRGAGNALVHEMARTAGAAGARRIGLGGGTTAAADDSLFAFKSSFGGDVRPFTVGLFTHDRRELASLVQAAERRDPSICASPLFLRYRRASGFSDGRMMPVKTRSIAGHTA